MPLDREDLIRSLDTSYIFQPEASWELGLGNESRIWWNSNYVGVAPSPQTSGTKSMRDTNHKMLLNFHEEPFTCKPFPTYLKYAYGSAGNKTSQNPYPILFLAGYSQLIGLYEPWIGFIIERYFDRFDIQRSNGQMVSAHKKEEFVNKWIEWAYEFSGDIPGKVHCVQKSHKDNFINDVWSNL